MKAQFLKINYLKHSGHGSPIHVRVMDEFRKSIKQGVNYCERKGWKVSAKNGILNIDSQMPFGFKFNAKYREVE